MRREIFAEGLVIAERFLKPKENPAMPNQWVRRSCRICTEADYLQAHLTVIRPELRHDTLTLHDAMQRMLRGWKRIGRRLF